MQDLRDGIMLTASVLGMDPVDLATIISYETAGTFDPTKRGLTTQWGQHRGLIQFGEPQAAQYGVDWNDPLNSQLGPDGAVVRYFQDNGWRPGMGLMDAYSIVNAGAPGRYNASDANNGGAPGTVADKVNNQMDDHRVKAAGLLGGTVQPQLSFGADVGKMGDPMQSGLMGMFDPRMLSMGAPAGLPQTYAAKRQEEQRSDRRSAEQDRRIALADLMRY